MISKEEKVLSSFVTKQVGKGETIEFALRSFYKNVRFADDEQQAKEILTESNSTLLPFLHKVVELKVDSKLITVNSYSLVSQDYVYVVSIEEITPVTLSEYYKQLRDAPAPQRDFREKIARACGVSDMTVYRWLSGEIVPEKLKREKIAEITGLTVDELFPNLPTND